MQDVGAAVARMRVESEQARMLRNVGKIQKLTLSIDIFQVLYTRYYTSYNTGILRENLDLGSFICHRLQ